MDDLFQTEPKKGNRNIFVIGIVIGVVALGGFLGYLSLKPSMEDQVAKILEGSYREGSPEFAALTKDIIISTDDNTVESPMASR